MSAETESTGGSVSMGGDAGTTQTFTPPTEPTPTVGHDEQTHAHPAGSPLPETGVPATERPEVLVGAAFAGGFLAALILKRLGR